MTTFPDPQPPALPGPVLRDAPVPRPPAPSEPGRSVPVPSAPARGSGRRRPLSAKRRFDLALALLLALPVGLVCAVVAAALLALQGRPVFYRSERMRTPDRGFVLWKFRTMTVADGAPAVTGGQVTARVTPLGHILRATRLDEFPQLWNVIRGDMSFVGPRPPLRAVVARHPAVYARVLSVPPGVTGLATVRYHRVEAGLLARCATQAEADTIYDRTCVRQKARLDLLYALRQGAGLDLAILWATATGRLAGSKRPVPPRGGFQQKPVASVRRRHAGAAAGPHKAVGARAVTGQSFDGQADRGQTLGARPLRPDFVGGRRAFGPGGAAGRRIGRSVGPAAP